jgi:hypothetical protein
MLGYLTVSIDYVKVAVILLATERQTEARNPENYASAERHQCQTILCLDCLLLLLRLLKSVLGEAKANTKTFWEAVGGPVK